ncbi:MAG TPA: glycosyltransferase family 39 protein [Burkholderiaceae bacterium]|nr:glycosyltransferase family 39 protein [Burkholderiaceae bacterium]
MNDWPSPNAAAVAGPPRPSGAALAIALIGALLALRLAFMPQPAVWIDEAFSLYHARHSLAHLWSVGWQLESSPPLYYTLMWLWTHLFGTSEWAARLLSWLLITASTFFVFRTACWLSGPRAGALAAVLFAGHPLVFEYSLEIRPYSLLLLLITIAAWGFARLIVQLEAGRLRTASGAAAYLAPIVLACVALTYTHATAPAFLAALSATGALYVLARQNRTPVWLGWAAANLAVFVAILPQIWVTLGVLGTNSAALSWIPKPTEIEWLSYVLRTLATGLHNVGATGVAAAIAAAVLGWAVWKMRDRPLVAIVGVVLPLFGLAALFVVSLIQPVLMPRTAMWLTVPLCVTVGAALAALSWQRPAPWVASAALVVMMTHLCIESMDVRAAQRWWPAVIEAQAREMRPGDEVVAIDDPEVLCVVDYYAAPPLRAANRWILRTDERYRPPQRIELGCNTAPRIDVSTLESRLSQGRGIWLLAVDRRQHVRIEALLRTLPKSVRIARRIERDGRIAALRLTVQ